MKVAVQGCCHGELDAIYKRIEQIESQKGFQVDLLLICGDFQAMRTQADLNCLAVPPKYLQMGDFPKYYSGEKVAPILTIVIGGNHEASNYMWELYHGGFLAPNIYYLGGSGVVRFNGLRIAGASGIFKSHDYSLGHYELLPYDKSSVRSIYHIRQYDVAKLMQVTSPDVFLSHDWPQSIEQHGNVRGLIKRKPFFEADIKSGKLGSPPLMDLLKHIRPAWWFSAHLHVKFEAEVVHISAEPSAVPPAVNPDEIQISFDEDDEDEEAKLPEPAPEGDPPSAAPDDSSQPSGARSTRFLALDKCLPKRDYLEVLDIDAPHSHSPPKFTFDPEWLAISRAMHPYLSVARRQTSLPAPEVLRSQIDEAAAWVKENVGEEKEIPTIQTFCMTSPGPIPGFKGKNFPQPSWYTNPQTIAFCEMLGIDNKVNPPPIESDAPVEEAAPTEVP